jgi:prophage regulatory protein
MTSVQRPSEQEPRLLRIKDVLSGTGLSESTLYREISAGRFPRPVKLTARTSAWLSSEVDDWISSRIAARDLS